MRLLLHICCAPCSVMSVETLRQSGIDVTGYWYNPNIHPYTEYRSRLDALQDYASQIALPLIINDDYGLRKFVTMVKDDLNDRCSLCYEDRLRNTALKAKEQGFDAFTSTLFISPYQQHDRLKAIAEQVAKEVGVDFHYVDFRPYYREGQKLARERVHYMQKYCGCIFSEEERYRNQKKR